MVGHREAVGVAAGIERVADDVLVAEAEAAVRRSDDHLIRVGWIGFTRFGLQSVFERHDRLDRAIRHVHTVLSDAALTQLLVQEDNTETEFLEGGGALDRNRTNRHRRAVGEGAEIDKGGGEGDAWIFWQQVGILGGGTANVGQGELVAGPDRAWWALDLFLCDFNTRDFGADLGTTAFALL